MFWKMWTIENTKTFKRSLWWIEVALLAALILGINLLLFGFYQSNLTSKEISAEDLEGVRMLMTWPAGLLTTLNFVSGNGLGGLLVIVLVGALTAQEYTWRTLHLWLSRGVSRATLLSAKFTALLLPVLLITLTPVIVGGAVTALFSLGFNGSLSLEQLNAAEMLLSILRTAYTLLPYAALAFLLSILTRSSVAAIGLGVGYSLLIEGIALQIMMAFTRSAGRIMAYLPGGLAQSVLQLNQNSLVMAGPSVEGEAVAASPLLSPLPAAVGIGLWTLLFVGLALWIFQRQDLAE